MTAELGLAVFAAVMGCVEIANKVISTYREYRAAGVSINEKVVALEALWTKVEIQLRVLGKVSHLLDPELAQSQLSLLQKLKGVLLRVADQLDGSTDGSGCSIAGSSPSPADPSLKQRISESLKRWKFAFAKKSLDQLMAELRVWYESWDPTWFLIILIGDKALDSALLESTQDGQAQAALAQNLPTANNLDPLSNMQALRRAIQESSASGNPTLSQNRASINLDADRLFVVKETPLEFSNAREVERAGSSTRLIIEPVDLSEGYTAQLKADTEGLARRLQQVNPDTFGILRCYGLLKRRDPVTGGLASVDVVYRSPSSITTTTNGTSSTPPPPPPPPPAKSLRRLLLDQEPVSASAVVRLAKQLVRSVLYVHACGFVHKNIRPENILVFPRGPSDDDRGSSGAGSASPSSSSPLGSSYLLGFSGFRSEHFASGMAGDMAWHRNLYRHPQRQGMFVEWRYAMQHDIYSLGVCLLEIGLWQSFVWCRSYGCPSGAPLEPSAALGLGLSDSDFCDPGRVQAAATKDHLVAMAQARLPPRLGDVYTGVVLTCLTCLDSDSAAFGARLAGGQWQWQGQGQGQGLADEDGVVVGVRYVESILMRMSEISI